MTPARRTKENCANSTVIPPKTDLFSHYAVQEITAENCDDSIHDKYNPLQPSRSLYRLFKEHECRE